MVRHFDDTLDRLHGRPVSPWPLRSRVPGDFRKVGQEFLGYLVELGGLKTDDHVLDIGHRAGRMAIPLTGYLDRHALYEGVDDWEAGTDWCREALTPRYPNFRFRHVQMAPEGGTDAVRAAADTQFPYDDDSFDLVILASIVHLPPSAFYESLGEAARVIRTGGTYFGTWFLRDEPFTPDDLPVPAIACSESEATQRLWSMNLVVEGIHRGRWNGHQPSLSYQDLIIARKRR
jgi:SAM-dependent methyltransferase